MKATSLFARASILAITLLLLTNSNALADNFVYAIATPGGGFSFTVTNLQANFTYPNTSPPLVLTAGATYRLYMDTTENFHPVVIVTNLGAFPPSGKAYVGASPQSVTSVPITVTLPATNFPPQLFYVCNIHGFSGLITILPPPAPNQISSITVTTNVVLRSISGTNTWVLIPEFSSNLLVNAWSPVSSYTNVIANVTNTTSTFDRLEPFCGPNVFLRVRLSPPQP